MNKNSEKNKDKKWTKCFFCCLFNRKKFNKCILLSMKNNKQLCTYNTFFSIWKWFVRLFHICLGYTIYWLLYLFSKWYWNCWFNIKSMLLDFWKGNHLSTIFFVIIHVILIAILVIMGHTQFKELDGKYYE